MIRQKYPGADRVNTIITFFDLYRQKCCPRWKYRPNLRVRYDVGGQYSRYSMKNSYYCIYCTDMLKTEQRQNKLFEFSQNSKREEFKITKNGVTLQWLRNLCCDGFRFFCLLMFTNKVIINVDDGIYRKTSSRRQGLLSQ